MTWGCRASTASAPTGYGAMAGRARGRGSTTVTPPKPKKPRRRKDNGGPDVYISYNGADESWVSETLLPQLEAAGLGVIIDYRDFEIGLPRLVNIERAVERSRHTLIVMTPE